MMCTEKYKTETCGRKTEHSHPCSSSLQGFVTEDITDMSLGIFKKNEA